MVNMMETQPFNQKHTQILKRKDVREGEVQLITRLNNGDILLCIYGMAWLK
jgi:hypothetical protein